MRRDLAVKQYSKYHTITWLFTTTKEIINAPQGQLTESWYKIASIFLVNCEKTPVRLTPNHLEMLGCVLSTVASDAVVLNTLRPRQMAAIFKCTWWRHQMKTFSALLAFCAENSPFPGEFSTQRPVTRSFDVFFDLHLNKQLSKQSRGWWFETPSGSLWCKCNDFLEWKCINFN